MEVFGSRAADGQTPSTHPQQRRPPIDQPTRGRGFTQNSASGAGGNGRSVQGLFHASRSLHRSTLSLVTQKIRRAIRRLGEELRVRAEANSPGLHQLPNARAAESTKLLLPAVAPVRQLGNPRDFGPRMAAQLKLTVRHFD